MDTNKYCCIKERLSLEMGQDSCSSEKEILTLCTVCLYPHFRVFSFFSLKWPVNRQEKTDVWGPLGVILVATYQSHILPCILSV